MKNRAKVIYRCFTVERAVRHSRRLTIFVNADSLSDGIGESLTKAQRLYVHKKRGTSMMCLFLRKQLLCILTSKE